jgi:EamA domain-containing membrane protein RarD
VPFLSIVLGLAGVALALAGFAEQLYPLVALGAAMVFGAFFLFARTNQGSPAPAGPEESRAGRK